MKKFLSILALFASVAHATTLNPIQLLNPTGSTSGQAILSTGAGTAPAWGNVSAAALTGITPVANGGTGWATLAAHNVLLGEGATQLSGAAPGASGTILASNGATSDPTFQTASTLGLAQLSGATFTGSVSVSPASGDSAITLNAVNANTADLYLQTGGVMMWGLVRNNVTNSGSNAGSNFQITRYTDAGASIDNPLVITRSTGVVTMPDGITNSPISGSTGSFTTLAASSTVSGTGFSNYLASPPCIGCTTANAGSFTNLTANGTITGIPGRLLNVQVFSSSGTYTPTTGTNSVVVEVLGGGGGGGGVAATSTGQMAAGAGGGSGSYSKGRITSGFSGVTVTVGGTGTGGTAGNNAGGSGGTSSFGTLIVCGGGGGGGGMAAQSAFVVSAPGSGGTVTTAGNIISSSGQVGGSGFPATSSNAAGGAGAPSALGGNVAVTVNGGAGNSAASKGAGGGGASAIASGAAAAGGNGGAGLVIVWEYQ